MSELTRDRLKELLHYDPYTGRLTWLVDRKGPARAGCEAGCDNGQGYRRIYVDGKPYKGHRLAWFYMTGQWPREVDHINGDRSDNSWANLREVTRSQNKMNFSVYRSNSSGYPGVSYYRRTGKWKAQIQKAGQKTFLGYHDTPEQAAAAYERAANELFGEYARAG